MITAFDHASAEVASMARTVVTRAAITGRPLCGSMIGPAADGPAAAREVDSAASRNDSTPSN
jgi:hypothetical protein